MWHIIISLAVAIGLVLAIAGSHPGNTGADLQETCAEAGSYPEECR